MRVWGEWRGGIELAYGEKRGASYTALVVLCRLALCSVVLVILFSALKVVAAAIPAQSLHESLVASAARLEEEGDYKRFMGDEVASQVDNWTTSIMLSMCAADRGSLIEAAFADWRYYDGTIGKNAHVVSLSQQVNGNMNPDDACWIPYARYWNGHLVVLKPLLLFLNLDGIRILFALIVAGLLLADACLLARMKGVFAGIVFAVSFLAVNCFIAAISLSLSFTVIIALACALFVLIAEKRKRGVLPATWWAVPFFTIGAITAYFDFLCTPVVTLGIPLALVVYLGAGDAPEGGRRSLLATLAISMVCWALGYGLLWAAKWVIATIVLGWDVIGDAVRQVVFHMSDAKSNTQSMDSPFEAIARNTMLLLPIWVAVAVFACCIAIALVVTSPRHRFRPLDWQAIVALLVVSTIPFIWYYFTPNHSYVHYWFTYRAQVVALVGILLAVDVFCRPLMAWRAKRGDS